LEINWRLMVSSPERILVDVAGCMAALDVEHYLQEVAVVGAQEGKSDQPLTMLE
jgi:hypothetical protein